MKLPAQARLVIAGWAMVGITTLTVAIDRIVATGLPGRNALVFAGVFGVLIAANWIWPLVVYIEEQSDGFDLDEGLFVILVLLVPSAFTVLVFAVATVVSQAIKRRPLVKSIFNFGQATTSVGAGVLVFVYLDHSEGSVGYARIGAALAGALVYFIVNANAVASILKTLGTPWRTTILGGLQIKVIAIVGSVSLAIPAALLTSRGPWFMPVAILPLVIFRFLVAGHFSARHDRARLRGLFESTLEINRSMGDAETRDSILHSARSLLRSPDATLTAEAPEGDSLSAAVALGDREMWLGVSGRSRTEPFDRADSALLNALASVGAVALTNTALFDEVRRQKDKLSAITNSLGEGVCAVSATGEMTFMNPAGAAMLGWSAPDDAAPSVQHARTTSLDFLVDHAMRSMASGKSTTSYDARLRRQDGTYFPATMTVSPSASGQLPAGAVIIFRDVSERKEFEEQLARHAFQDSLTGLANRRLLLDHLDHALLRTDRSGEKVAILFCDVDRFKVVNDNLGHQAGDEFLGIIADRLRMSVRPGDTISRFGGDEFIILLDGVMSQEGPERVARAIQEALSAPVTLAGGHEVVATMSIGIALSSPGKSRDDLLHDADVAMYRAKDRGRGGKVAVFDGDEMGKRSPERVAIETALRHSLERREIEVYYQPLVSLTDRRVIGAEALVRWNRPGQGLLLPAQFIHLAEETGAIVPIGRAVLEQACRQAHAWYQTLGVAIEVGVNLSARQFERAELAEEIEEVLRVTGIDPAQLCLEITEGLAMADIDLTTAILCKLHTLGVRVAIDDFGTGHSSLGYLARFPIDVVKIDQSFVRDIEYDRIKSAIVSAVVTMSRAIGSTIVVEGVESLGQLEHVRKLGCDVAQGFYFARPMPASAFGELLNSQASTRPNLRVVPAAG